MSSNTMNIKNTAIASSWVSLHVFQRKNL